MWYNSIHLNTNTPQLLITVGRVLTNVKVITMATSDYTSQIPYGYCQCGCGQKTNLNPCSNSKIGMIKGEPRSFVYGHGVRNRSMGHYKTRRSSFTREDGTIEIELTKGYVALVSPEDVDLAEYNWTAHKRNQYHYAARSNGITIHSTVLERMLGRTLTDDELVDHINGDTLNNRRDNLRLADTQKNNFNSKTRNDNTSGYKGVSYHKQANKWRARIWGDGKRIHLGSFDTPELAYEAYCNASKVYHGNFGRVK